VFVPEISLGTSQHKLRYIRRRTTPVADGTDKTDRDIRDGRDTSDVRNPGATRNDPAAPVFDLLTVAINILTTLGAHVSEVPAVSDVPFAGLVFEKGDVLSISWHLPLTTNIASI
jgi:hypothetical protein